MVSSTASVSAEQTFLERDSTIKQSFSYMGYFDWQEVRKLKVSITVKKRISTPSSIKTKRCFFSGRRTSLKSKSSDMNTMINDKRLALYLLVFNTYMQGIL